MNLNAKLKVNDNLSVLIEVPYAKGGNDFWGLQQSKSESDVTFGNPLIGFEINNSDGDLIYEFGLRIPGTNKDSWRAISTGYSVDQERVGAFNSDAITLYGLINYKPLISKSFYILVNFGPGFYSAKNFSFPQVSLLYSNRIGFKNDLFDLAAGLGMMLFLTGGNASMSERTSFHFELSMSANVSNFVPGIIYRLPFWSSGSSDGVIALNLGYLF